LRSERKIAFSCPAADKVAAGQRIGNLSAPTLSYYGVGLGAGVGVGVGVGEGVGVGVGDEQEKFDRTTFPGALLNASVSTQSPLVCIVL
jgi:hypothetical protein